MAGPLQGGDGRAEQPAGYHQSPPDALRHQSGGVFDDIRIEHAKRITQMDLDGYAVGGLAVGETHEEMYRVLDSTVPHLPQDRPVYLMGVGTPPNILEGVERGIDFFDCVYPSRNGRHGHVYTNHGKMNLFNAQYERDDRPSRRGCGCPACRNHSRAYIRHLLKAGEMLGMRLCVLHNLYFYNNMMEEIREAIEEGRYQAYKKQKALGNGGTSMNGTMTILYIIFIVGIMYFMAIRPQRKEKKAHDELLASVAVGDSILTSSGFYGVIIDMTDDTVIVEFGSNKNCRIPMRKEAIVQVEKPEA